MVTERFFGGDVVPSFQTVFFLLPFFDFFFQSLPVPCTRILYILHFRCNFVKSALLKILLHQLL